jgi:lipid-A-disaccharide synthase
MIFIPVSYSHFKIALSEAWEMRDTWETIFQGWGASVRIFFSVGEPSGDLHGANFIRALQARLPNVTCTGFGGPKMQAAGCNLMFDLTQLAVMWLGRVLWNLPTFFHWLAEAEKVFDNDRPDAVVMIDYPGFNWHIARKAKDRGIPVFYYGVPQLWAWAPWRIKKMRSTVDHALCKLPFEESWFRERGVNASFVGHPYFDEMAQQQYNTSFLEQQQQQPERLVTLLPGSRTQEVKANLPAFIKTVRHMQTQVKNVRYAVAAFNEKQATLARELLQREDLNIPVYVGKTPELIRAATCCLACSGSVSLELMWHEKPTVIHYKTSPWLYALGRYVMTVKYITLVNILADAHAFENVHEPFHPQAANANLVPFPEYPTCQDRSTDMAKHLCDWLNHENLLQQKISQLQELKHRYALPGASERAAEYVASYLASGASTSLRKAG